MNKITIAVASLALIFVGCQVDVKLKSEASPTPSQDGYNITIPHNAYVPHQNPKWEGEKPEHPMINKEGVPSYEFPSHPEESRTNPVPEEHPVEPHIASEPHFTSPHVFVVPHVGR